jgi:hypothetical protein
MNQSADAMNQRTSRMDRLLLRQSQTTQTNSRRDEHKPAASPSPSPAARRSTLGIDIHLFGRRLEGGGLPQIQRFEASRSFVYEKNILWIGRKRSGGCYLKPRGSNSLRCQLLSSAYGWTSTRLSSRALATRVDRPLTCQCRRSALLLHALALGLLADSGLKAQRACPVCLAGTAQRPTR